MADGFGGALCDIIGGGMGSDAIQAGMEQVGLIGSAGQKMVQPFIDFGTGLMPDAGAAIDKVNAAAGNVPQFEDFMKDFSLSSGAQYTMDKTLGAADTSAAARGGLLSGANLRNRMELANGIVGQDIAQQYGLTLGGNQQAFGQLTGAAGTTLGGVGVGTTGAGIGMQGIVAQMNAMAQLAAAQAKSDSQKGGGIGSMIGGFRGGGSGGGGSGGGGKF